MSSAKAYVGSLFDGFTMSRLLGGLSIPGSPIRIFADDYSSLRATLKKELTELRTVMQTRALDPRELETFMARMERTVSEERHAH